MASSRWKRFAFFERNTLSLASEVLEDIIPIEEGRRSLNALNNRPTNKTANNDAVSLVVTTAALPMNSKPKKKRVFTADNNSPEASAVDDMWSSLAACAPMELPDLESGGTIRLPSQAQFFEDDTNIQVSKSPALDGLVLAFITSKDTENIHCFDVTVRCNPPDKSSNKDSLEDLDGWRGYLAPFKGQQKIDHTTPQTSVEDRIISEHMEPEAGKEGIVAIATCRASSGHRPLHMACITQSKVVVCVDPHLYLSW